jgi:hypothetical protein
VPAKYKAIEARSILKTAASLLKGVKPGDPRERAANVESKRGEI